MSLISNLVLPPLSLVYRAVTKTRLAAYKKGLLSITRLDAPLISVGNLTTGGTGKTPLVEQVCRILARSQRRVCVLTRGYGRVNPGARVLVSDGSTVLATAAEAGDEPFLLAQNLKGLAAVVSDADRATAGQWVKENLGADVFVLDDGFQHLRLARDLDLLVIDATNPWGGGRLLPYGRLREPRSEVSRADCIIVTRADQSGNLLSLKEEICRFNNSSPILTSTMTVRSITRLASTVEEEIDSVPQPVAAFCAIGNPKSFFDQLRLLELNPIFTREFPDHHRYTPANIESLNQKSKAAGVRSLITTAKDAVKLQADSLDVPCYVLNIEISIEDDRRFTEMIEDALRT